ncbi:hypothetical protein [endosymbiont of Lamellibrachia barhami]|uniref:hypothetical protein n=1 Tax=endosymbiont of Lamellibrachia barhami TaxID=205975 RepID=UPI0015B31EDF|nr:hypothetical protein [endosymbiont of Lamellibrachia barhami]
MNDAGPVPNPLIGTVNLSAVISLVLGQTITAGDVPARVIDPYFDPQYSQFCYTFQYIPRFNDLPPDTPVLPVARIRQPRQVPLWITES